MNEMVEIVARAICVAAKMNPDDAMGGWVHWKEEARAAIEAMREPTEAMIEYADKNTRAGHDGEDLHAVWVAMIDPALTPPQGK